MTIIVPDSVYIRVCLPLNAQSLHEKFGFQFYDYYYYGQVKHSKLLIIIIIYLCVQCTCRYAVDRNTKI